MKEEKKINKVLLSSLISVMLMLAIILMFILLNK